METKPSIEQFVRAQIERWHTQTGQQLPVITISSEPGSGGRILAQALAQRLKIDLFDRDIIKEIAESARISGAVIESLEKERFTGVQDFISSLVNDRYLWPGVYLEHLMKVVAVIASHGNAIIVGRGANFLIPPRERLSIRVIAPLDVRIANVAKEFNVSREDARRRVINRENRRAAFIRQSFNAEVADPHNYNLVINTDGMDIDTMLGAVAGMVLGAKAGTQEKHPAPPKAKAPKPHS